MVIAGQAWSATYVGIAIAATFFVILLLDIAVHWKTKRKIAELERKVATLEQNQSEISANLEYKFAALQELLLEKTNPLAQKLKEISKRTNLILERYDALGREIDKRVDPLKASFDDTVDWLHSSQKTMKKVIKENGNEIGKMEKHLTDVRKEIQQLKDFIRERTIDLEL